MRDGTKPLMCLESEDLSSMGNMQTEAYALNESDVEDLLQMEISIHLKMMGMVQTKTDMTLLNGWQNKIGPPEK